MPALGTCKLLLYRNFLLINMSSYIFYSKNMGIRLQKDKFLTISKISMTCIQCNGQIKIFSTSIRSEIKYTVMLHGVFVNKTNTVYPPTSVTILLFIKKLLAKFLKSIIQS